MNYMSRNQRLSLLANIENNDVYQQFVNLVTSASVEPPPCSSDPEMWWSHDPHEIVAAKEACRSCPLQSPCLKYAIEGGEPEGVWGGADRDERHTMFLRLRQMQREAGVKPIDRREINRERGRNYREALK